MVQDTRELNRRAVLTALMQSRPASRKSIAGISGISAATVTRAVDQLITEGIIAETGEVVSESRGRRAVQLDLVSERKFVVGLDLGASNTRLILADLLGHPIVVLETPTPTEATSDELARWLATTLRATVGSSWERIEYICIGLPGAVNQRQHRVSNATNLPQVEEKTFLGDVEEAMAKPVAFDNDANYALLGEQRFGAARSTSNAAMLTIGSGLGVGLAIDGRILQGEHGLIGEFGQLPAGPFGARLGGGVAIEGGMFEGEQGVMGELGQLPAGPFGTRLEHMVTGGGIIRWAAEAGIDLTLPNELFTSNAGPALNVLRAHFDQALLIVLTATTVACDPETIVFGGGIAKSLASTLDRYQMALEQNLRASPRLATADLGDFSGAVGGVVAALQRVYWDLGIDEAVIVSLPRGDSLSLDRIQEVQYARPRSAEKIQDLLR